MQVVQRHSSSYDHRFANMILASTKHFMTSVIVYLVDLLACWHLAVISAICLYGVRWLPAEGAAVVAAGGAGPAEGVPAGNHDRVNVVAEADSTAQRLHGCLAIPLQILHGLHNSITGVGTLRTDLRRKWCHSLQGCGRSAHPQCRGIKLITRAFISGTALEGA